MWNNSSASVIISIHLVVFKSNYIFYFSSKIVDDLLLISSETECNIQAAHYRFVVDRDISQDKSFRIFQYHKGLSN